MTTMPCSKQQVGYNVVTTSRTAIICNVYMGWQ